MAPSPAELVAIARAEAAKMQAAIKGAESDAKVHMSVEQFSKLAGLINLVCDHVPEAGGPGRGAGYINRKEGFMEAGTDGHAARSLAQIESDMLASEAAFADADERFKQAERDRAAAIDALNGLQAEIDAAIAKLRQRSPAGAKWHSASDGSEEVLMLENMEASPAERDLIEDRHVSVENNAPRFSES